MSSSVGLCVCRLSLCRLPVTFVHPTQPIEIFGNVSAPFNTMVTWRYPGKILRRSSQGNPSVGGVKPKSYMSFRLLQKSATLNERKESSGSLSHLLMNFLFIYIIQSSCRSVNWAVAFYQLLWSESKRFGVNRPLEVTQLGQLSVSSFRDR